MTRLSRAALVSFATTGLLGLSLARAAHAETVIQLPVTGILDKRSVTTLTGGSLVVFDLPTDGGGLQNAFMTNAGAAKQNAPAGHALPDDGRFPANTRHPEVVLHFANDADATAPQTRLMLPGATFVFPVPAATYSKLFLFFNGAAGGTTVDVTLTYSDGTEVQHATIPDYYNDPTDTAVFHLATDLAKWTKTNTINEANHHNIDGAEFHPAAGKTLTSVTVARGANGNLVFWGATAIATSDVSSGGSGGASNGGAGGTSGGASPGGAPSTGGTGGSGGSGTAGSSPGAAGAVSAGAPSSAGASGSPSSAGASNASGGALDLPNSAANDSGCSLASGQRERSHPWSPWLLLGAVASYGLARRRR